VPEIIALAMAASVGTIIGLCVGVIASTLAGRELRQHRAPGPPSGHPEVPPPTPPPGPTPPFVYGTQPITAHPRTGRPTIGRGDEQQVKAMAERIRTALAADADDSGALEIKPAVNALGDIMAMLLGHYAASVDPEDQSTAMVRQTVDEIFEAAVTVAFKERARRAGAGEPPQAGVPRAEAVH
jgi:hypothetical protein